ncbi:hypothetical protein CEUSTIGMA_g10407.t1 [Chlamydomonas eustigma]|uniref:HIRAN domain-containing protein n=1 Tax=Chlamydomonas eustigma TaxID=1157962 RepID=A0A250XJJ9_9CHLO|nr:hypothetical protein CEUSTIGMA_g10407.t1 [Chlamydomonas eustigma]|eukprot:GAX82980.1 hypothetical protein CEUSTIGMA_g10407.t1 [Chlamydomonas eustigma]
MNLNFTFKYSQSLRRYCFPLCHPPSRSIQYFPSAHHARTQLSALATVSALESPLYLRKTYEALSHWELVKLAGVTFDGRQENVKDLSPGQPVMLLREPWNPYDSEAVRVETLSGQQLGYIPRDHNNMFQVHEILFGHVQSVGQSVETDNWGAKVSAYPLLMSPFISPLPSQLYLNKADQGICNTSSVEREASTSLSEEGGLSEQVESKDVVSLYTAMLQSAIAPQHWQRLVEEARARGGGGCEVTGAPPGSATYLDVVPIWQYNEELHTIQLMRLAVVCREVSLTHYGLDLLPSTPEREVAISTLRSINDWSDDDVQEHWDHARHQRELLVLQKDMWSVDLSTS